MAEKCGIMPPLMSRLITARERVSMHPANPVWRPENQYLRCSVPEGLLSWLLDTDSLTRRISQKCRGCFRVRVLDQGWGYPRHDERLVLRIPARQRVTIRQVQLLCNEVPWVFARTLIPVSTLHGPQRRLAYLGNKPLGAYLFADPSMRRGPVELARISRRHAMYLPATSGIKTKPADIWGRRSVFWIGGKPLLVSEVFLPDLLLSG